MNKKLSIVFLILLFSCHYNHSKGDINSTDVKDIVIYDRTSINTGNPKKITLNSWFAIKRLVWEVNNIKPTQEANLRQTFGSYEMILNLKDGTYKSFEVFYTTYDGVIIQKGDELHNYYKNDDLERTILLLFRR